MSISAEVSYFSRFLVKFIEIVAAGLATAVSGYLIAHLSGALSSPAPIPAAAVNQVMPSTSAPSSLPLQPNSTQPAATQPAASNAPPPVVQPGQTTADTKKAEARKRAENATNAPESNQQRKPLLARVRAALAKVDAKGTDPLAVVPPPAGLTRPSAAMAQPQPVVVPPAITSPPLTAGEVRSTPSQDAAGEPNPLPTVEITSRPVAEPAAPPTEMSPLEQRLRQDPLIGAMDPPRPPMPVAQ
jgi:hypothetical protein